MDDPLDELDNELENFYEEETETYATLFVAVALLGVALAFLLHKKKVL